MEVNKPHNDLNDRIKMLEKIVQTNPAYLVGYIEGLEMEINRIKGAMYLPLRSSIFERGIRL